MNLEEQIIKELNDEMTKAIDFEVLADVMCRFGWSRVEVSRLKDNYHAIDMREWAEKHCEYEFKHNGRTWIFQSQSDAVFFKLKWA